MKTKVKLRAMILTAVLVLNYNTFMATAASSNAQFTSGDSLVVDGVVLVSGGVQLAFGGEFQGGTFSYNAQENRLLLTNYGAQLEEDEPGGEIACKGMGDFTIELIGENRIRGVNGIRIEHNEDGIEDGLTIAGNGTLSCVSGQRTEGAQGTSCGIQVDGLFTIDSAAVDVRCLGNSSTNMNAVIAGNLKVIEGKLIAQGSSNGIVLEAGGIQVLQGSFVKGVGQKNGISCETGEVLVDNSTLIGIGTGNETPFGIRSGGKISVWGFSEVVATVIKETASAVFNQEIRSGEFQIQVGQDLMIYGGSNAATARTIPMERITQPYQYIRIIPKNTFIVLKSPWLNLHSIAQSQQRLNFSNIKGENGYEVWRKIGRTGEWNLIQSLSENEVKYMDFCEEVPVYYRVRGFKIRGAVKVYGPWSRIVSRRE
ncbi:MAG: hypothetical protein RSI06_05910 [Lachnospiraceae bacterium]